MLVIVVGILVWVSGRPSMGLAAASDARGRAVVTDVTPGALAWAAGVQPGMTVTSVDWSPPSPGFTGSEGQVVATLVDERGRQSGGGHPIHRRVPSPAARALGGHRAPRHDAGVGPAVVHDRFRRPVRPRHRDAARAPTGGRLRVAGPARRQRDHVAAGRAAAGGDDGRPGTVLANGPPGASDGGRGHRRGRRARAAALRRARPGVIGGTLPGITRRARAARPARADRHEARPPRQGLDELGAATRPDPYDGRARRDAHRRPSRPRRARCWHRRRRHRAVVRCGTGRGALRRRSAGGANDAGAGPARSGRRRW